MMYRWIGLVVLAAGLYSCDKDEQTDADTERTLWSNTVLVSLPPTDSTAAMLVREPRAGRELLEARRRVDPVPEAIDDEHTRVLYIPLSSTQRSFQYRDEELAKAGVALNFTECFCAGNQLYPVTQGSLRGERQVDGSWTEVGSSPARWMIRKTYPTGSAGPGTYRDYTGGAKV